MKKLLMFITLNILFAGCSAGVKAQVSFADPNIYDSVSTMNPNDLFQIRNTLGIVELISWWRLNQLITGGSGSNVAKLDEPNIFTNKNQFDGPLKIPNISSFESRAIWLSDTIMYYRAWNDNQSQYLNYALATRDWVTNNFSNGSGTGSYATTDGNNDYTGRNTFKNVVKIDGSAGGVIETPKYDSHLSLIDDNVGAFYWMSDETISLILKLSNNDVVRRNVATREWVQSQGYASSSSFVDLSSNQTIDGVKKFINAVDVTDGALLLRAYNGGLSPNVSQKFKLYYNQQIDELQYIDSVAGQTDVYARRGFPSYWKTKSMIDTTLKHQIIYLSGGSTIDLRNGNYLYRFSTNPSGATDTIYIRVANKITQLWIKDNSGGTANVVFRSSIAGVTIYSQNGGQAYKPSADGRDVISIVGNDDENVIFISWVNDYAPMQDPTIE